jgi:hypothetical protein
MTGLAVGSGIGARLSGGSMPLPVGAGPVGWMPGVGTASRFSLKPFWVPILVLALRFAPGGFGHLAYLFLFCYAFAVVRPSCRSISCAFATWPPTPSVGRLVSRRSTATSSRWLRRPP